MKDLFAKEIKVGDRVIYVYKSYGYGSISSVSLCYGFVDKVTEKTVLIKAAIKVGNRICVNKKDQWPTKVVANFGDKTDSVMVVDKFPTAIIKALTPLPGQLTEIWR